MSGLNSGIDLKFMPPGVSRSSQGIDINDLVKQLGLAPSVPNIESTPSFRQQQPAPVQATLVDQIKNLDKNSLNVLIDEAIKTRNFLDYKELIVSILKKKDKGESDGIFSHPNGNCLILLDVSPETGMLTYIEGPLSLIKETTLSGGKSILEIKKANIQEILVLLSSWISSIEETYVNPLKHAWGLLQKALGEESTEDIEEERVEE